MDNYKINYSAATAPGNRDENQDVFLADEVVSKPKITNNQYYQEEFDLSDKIRLFVVADGVGSLRDSADATKIALDAIKDKVEKTNIDEKIEEINLKEFVIDAITTAQRTMINYCSQMVTCGSSTITLLAIRGREFVFANIGDSPAFLLRNDNEIRELSLRHNMATLKKLLNEDFVEGEERMLLYHLGEKNINVSLTANVVCDTIKNGDAFLLCSDGVFNVLGLDRIREMLTQRKLSFVFVTEATESYDSDNCTAITIYVDNQ